MDNQCATRDTSENHPALQSCFSPNKATFKCVGLVLMCLIGFGIYYCYDNPGALQDKFETDLNIPASEFVLLYSVYSWPNVILNFIGGFLLDRVFGVRWGTILYASLVLFGQLLFAVGTYVNIFWIMILGRFIFGCGGESLIIAQNSYAILWFKGKALNTLFGLQITISRLGSTANSLTLENIYNIFSETSNYTGPERIGSVLFIASLTCVFSVICALLLGCMDNHTEQVLKRNEEKQPEVVKLSDVKKFNMTFWLIVLVCVAYNIAILPFMSLGKLYFMTEYELGSDVANALISLVFTISAIASPFFGILMDKTGKNILGVIASIVGSLIAHGLLTFTFMSPHVCMVLLGMAFSLFTSSFWPLIAFVVPEHRLGTAYGIAQSLLNLNLAAMSIVCGIIVDNYGYFMLELFFLAWLLISLVPAILIWTSNEKSVSEAKSCNIQND